LRVLPPDVEARIAAYACNDVALTYKVALQLLQQYPPAELKLIDLTVRMFTQPTLLVDTAALEVRVQQIKDTKDALLASAGLTRAVIMSNQQFGAWLESRGVAKPASLAKTSPEVQALLEHEDETISAAVAARIGVKGTMEQTRAERLIDVAGRGAVPIYLYYYGAHTGRWSGGDKLNPQNLKRKSVLRTALRAPDGYQLVVADSAQIEVRVLAWLAGATGILESFAAGRDVYKDFARVLFPGDEISSEKRFVAKTCILGLGYGTGAVKLRASLASGATGPRVHVDEATAQRYVTTYRTSDAAIPALWRRAGTWLRVMATGATTTYTPITISAGGIELPNGMRMRYPGMMQDNEGWTYAGAKGERTRIYGAKLIENVVQALARIIIGEQLLIIAQRYPIVTTTHDEIVALAPTAQADAALAFMLDVMRTPPAWAAGIPLGAEGGYATNYSK
jgi:DNA polymerase